MTYKELKSIVDSLSEEQLNQVAYFYPMGWEYNALSRRCKAFAEDKLIIEFADFDYYFYEGPKGHRIGDSYKHQSLEELQKELGDDFDPKKVIMSHIKKGMPYFNKITDNGPDMTQYLEFIANYGS